MKKSIGSYPRVRVGGGGRGVVSQAGGVLLVETVCKSGLDRAISAALAPWRRPRAVHDPGKILLDVALAVALDGDCLADVGMLRAEPAVFGPVASDPTVSRLIDTLAAGGKRALTVLRQARTHVREYVWTLAGDAAPDAAGQVVVDLDGVLVIAHSEKQDAAATWKKSFGHHPLMGFSVRRYRNGKLLTKPSKAAVRRIRSRLAAEVEALHGANAEAVINKLNPVIRGWAAYYRTGVSKEIFSSLDHYVWRLTYRWGLRAHPNKSERWVVTRYFGAFHPTRRDRWVFGNRDTGRFLVKFSWTKIVRHRPVKGRASPDDPALTGYWADRRRRRKPPLGRFGLRLLHAQRGRCPACGTLLLHADQEPVAASSTTPTGAVEPGAYPTRQPGHQPAHLQESPPRTSRKGPSES